LRHADIEIHPFADREEGGFADAGVFVGRVRAA
jgi:hypothetical protein